MTTQAAIQATRGGTLIKLGDDAVFDRHIFESTGRFLALPYMTQSAAAGFLDPVFTIYLKIMLSREAHCPGDYNGDGQVQINGATMSQAPSAKTSRSSGSRSSTPLVMKLVRWLMKLTGWYAA